ncbi:MAG TPA: dTDP-glucose 4,6-dehydratase [Rubricoccaceae bacterium]|nr:dTDP-glucose 4,6-dehydratase [Rubricoccaceae bacterium]
MPQHTPTSVLVTGGAGFIGSNFLLRMVPRHPGVRFVNLDLLTYAGNLLNLQAVEDAPNYAFVQGDIADADLVGGLFAAHGFSTVVHFAAESHVDRSILDPLAFVRTNVLGTATLLDAARQAWLAEGPPGDVRFHHVSTDEVFGALAPGDPPFSEVTPYDPHSPYSASKAGSDHLARAYFDTYGLPVVVSNCSNNYGPYQFPEKLVPLIIARAAALEPLPVYGKGENVRDWLHVEDHAAAIERILFAGETGETYCVGGGAERRNLEVVETLCDLVDEALGRPAGTARAGITFVTDRPGHDFRYAMDFSKLERELGWRPAHSFEDGMRDTVRWYLEHRDWLDAVMDASYRDYYERQYGGRG